MIRLFIHNAKRITTPALLALLMLTCGVGSLQAGAQNPGANTAGMQPPRAAAEPQHVQDLQVNPLVAMRDFEPPLNADYQLGRGDEISINFAGRTELDSKRTLGPDGRITLPLAGSISLLDKTREQAADTIVAALSPYYTRLSATVAVDRYTSNRVLLLGAVRNPGIVQFDQPPTLLEALTKGGGLTSGDSNTTSGGGSGGSGGGGGGFGGNTQAREVPAVPERCAIYRGSDRVIWVNLKGLLDSGNMLADLRLKRDDVIYVPNPAELYVSVLGQVQHPGALQLDGNTTLPKLLAEAGGLTVQAGTYPDIRIIQQTTGAVRIISMKTVLTGKPLDLTLKSGDIIYVPESGFNKFTYGIERLSPLVTSFTAAALINR